MKSGSKHKLPPIKSYVIAYELRKQDYELICDIISETIFTQLGLPRSGENSVYVQKAGNNIKIEVSYIAFTRSYTRAKDVLEEIYPHRLVFRSTESKMGISDEVIGSLWDRKVGYLIILLNKNPGDLKLMI